MLLSDYLTAAANRWPDAIAVQDGEQRITFAELDHFATRLAHQLLEAGCRCGDRVVIAAPRSIPAIASIQGALKAGAIYVPLDVDSPAPRLAHVLKSTEPKMIMATNASMKLIDAAMRTAGMDGSRSTTIIGSLEPTSIASGPFNSTFNLSDVSRQPITGLRPCVDASSVAHLLFTSGSTGLPKGVMVTHASVVAFIEWAKNYFDIRPRERLSAHPPLHFDLSTFDMFGGLSSGAEIHLVPKEANLLAVRLRDFIAGRALTQWFSVPSVLNLLVKFDTVQHGDFPSLRRLMWCGEVLPTPTLIYLMERLPHVRFTNLYGPTEATIASSYYTVPSLPVSAQMEIPIGTPCTGEELLVLDDQLRELPPGELGDLYIAGCGLSPGYWRDPEKTSTAFKTIGPISGSIDGHDSADRAVMTDQSYPFGMTGKRIYRTGDLGRRGTDGYYYFHGRIDSQIKSRGYRIELGEIEASLYALPQLRESAVVAIPSAGFDGMMICCAFVPESTHIVDGALLRRDLAATLPSYMLPTRWLSLPALPKNQNGKVDRPALKAMFEDHEATATRI